MILEKLPEDNTGRLHPGITRDEAFALVEKYNKEPFHIQHAETVEAVMRYFAAKLGYSDEADFWGLVGLLHDLDFEQFPDEHCIKVREIFDAEGIKSSDQACGGITRLRVHTERCEAGTSDGKSTLCR